MAPALNPKLKHLLKRANVIAISSALALTALAYAADYAIFHHRVTTNHQPFGQIMVTTYDAVPQKSGRTQLIFNPPELQTCANALFPRQGRVPCWYLQRHAEQRINM